MAANVPILQLSNGANFPLIGFGTWKAQPGVVGSAIGMAIDNGCRHLDCAAVYQNEKEIGTALKAIFAQGRVQRQELFITSKLWNTMHDPKDVPSAIKKTLQDLQLDYLDLYLIHWPVSFVNTGEGVIVPKTPEGKVLYADIDYIDTWKAMEKLVQDGLVKAIGLSNFNSKQIQRVLDNCTIKPAVLQIESHPYLNQHQLISFAQSKGIAVTAYSPLGSKDRPWAASGDPELLKDPTVNNIAQRHNKSAAQILLRFQLQRDVAIIPKSVNESRIQQNLQLTKCMDTTSISIIATTIEEFNDEIDCRLSISSHDSILVLQIHSRKKDFLVANFQLSEEDMNELMGISTKFRFCEPKTTVNGKVVVLHSENQYFPFHEPF